MADRDINTTARNIGRPAAPHRAQAEPDGSDTREDKVERGIKIGPVETRSGKAGRI